MLLARLLVVAWLLRAIAAGAQPSDAIAPGWRFLVTPREQGGVLYSASAAELRGRSLPLGFADDTAYWAREVCRFPERLCAVRDRYDARAYTLLPEQGAAGDLQTERVNTHAGTNIYDAATWQIALVLGAWRLGLATPQMPVASPAAACELAGNQTRALALGYFGDAAYPVDDMIRGVTRGELFVYNGQRIVQPRHAYAFRSLPRRWLAQDPLFMADDADWHSLLAVEGLPAANPEYRAGTISWTDWKPITGENAWAFLIGPLQAARICHGVTSEAGYVPFDDIAVQNALPVLDAFAAMQTASGAVLYAPAGTLDNEGRQPVDPHFVAVENDVSLFAGLRLLDAVLSDSLRRESNLDITARQRAEAARAQIRVLLGGGRDQYDRDTRGLVAFLRERAWQDGEFVRGGSAGDSAQAWVPITAPRAVDVNTWGIAALGARTIDQWFGFGSSFRCWQRLRGWGGYGADGRFAGVGYSDTDGNGRAPDGSYRSGVLSVEWTAGAITAVREMLDFYSTIPAGDARYAEAAAWIGELRADEQAMLGGIEALARDAPGSPRIRSYLYASRRAFVPFGWYANPLPSTCATAWRVLLAARFNPFATGSASRW